ncbi:hypothetical protein MVEN_02592700 [Mycena venus]|uniref:Uncharacterized protein n=1 Tax=Mycena venus TaxID=2733690 RepID=A0A8H6TZ25_9AGAR|nr:hypothetical protein MVEN_02592700 [Mycena venus]
MLPTPKPKPKLKLKLKPKPKSKPQRGRPKEPSPVPSDTPYEDHPDSQEEDNDEESAESKSRAAEEAADSDEEDPPPKRRKTSNAQKSTDSDGQPIVDITFNLSIFTSSEMAKQPSTKRQAIGGFFKLSSSAVFYRFEKKVIAKVVTIAKLVVPPEDDEYTLYFTVPRHVKDKIALDDSEAYNHLIAKALKCKDPTANIIVELKAEEAAAAAPAEPSKKKGKKSKIPSENDILPANAEINNKIAQLRAKWTCHAADGSDYCYVSGDDKEHIPLGNPHFSTWAAACLNGAADDETPPNHKLFNPKSNSSRLAPPTILQRRIAQANESATPAAPIIHNNFSFPDGLVDLLRGGPAHPSATTPTTSSSLSAAENTMLLPPNTGVGARMPISDFCERYDLGTSIAEKLTNNGYKYSSVFYLIKLSELKEMEFRPGEVAELRDAVGQWAVPL